MCRPVPRLPVVLDPVVPESRSHAAASLVLKRGIRNAYTPSAEAATIILALNHLPDARFVQTVT